MATLIAPNKHQFVDVFSFTDDVTSGTKQLFDDFKIVRCLEPIEIFSFSHTQEDELIRLQDEYSAAKLGCVRSAKTIASTIVDTVRSFNPDSNYCNYLVVVPPTYDDDRFHSAQLRLQRNVSQQLGTELFDWGLKFSGENGGRPYSQCSSVEERIRLTHNCLKSCIPSQKIKDRDVIIVDDVWVTGSAAKATCNYLRESGARSVNYCAYASISNENAANEYLLNGLVIFRRNWKALESILYQKELPTRHLFNLIFEDPRALDIFNHFCPTELQLGLLRLAVNYYSGRTVLPDLKRITSSPALEKLIHTI